MAEPDWAKVLRVMHEDKKAKGTVQSDDESVQVKHLSEETDLEQKVVEDILQYMKRVGLIEPISSEDAEDKGPFALSAKGFEVAHTRKLKEERFEHESDLAQQRDRTNTTLVGFTLALVLASLVAVLPTTWTFLGYAIPLRLVGAFVLLGVVVWYILHTDLHEDLLDL